MKREKLISSGYSIVALEFKFFSLALVRYFAFSTFQYEEEERRRVHLDNENCSITTEKKFLLLPISIDVANFQFMTSHLGWRMDGGK
jgi:hypothetical protein